MENNFILIILLLNTQLLAIKFSISHLSVCICALPFKDERTYQCCHHAHDYRSNKNDEEDANCIQDLLSSCFTWVLTEFRYCVIHNDRNGIVKDTLAKHNRVKILVSIHLLENG